jgi:site-specific DNA-methyltransferase (adenine-specific)
MAALWAEFRRIIKPSGVIVCHAVQPFTTDLICAARDMFRYSLVWHKSAKTHHVHCNKRPLCQHEDVLIFAPGRLGTMTYNAVGATNDKLRRVRQDNPRAFAKDTGQRAGKVYMATTGHPASILCHDNPAKTLHETQKPESLMEFIVQAYSNPGAIVFDPTMGSGTTGVAALRHDRQFIGIERDVTFFEHAYHRIHAEHSNLQKSAA